MKKAHLVKYLQRVKDSVKNFKFFGTMYVSIKQKTQEDLFSKLYSTKMTGHNVMVI